MCIEEYKRMDIIRNQELCLFIHPNPSQHKSVHAKEAITENMNYLIVFWMIVRRTELSSITHFQQSKQLAVSSPQQTRHCARQLVIAAKQPKKLKQCRLCSSSSFCSCIVLSIVAYGDQKITENIYKVWKKFR